MVRGLSQWGQMVSPNPRPDGPMRPDFSPLRVIGKFNCPTNYIDEGCICRLVKEK